MEQYRSRGSDEHRSIDLEIGQHHLSQPQSRVITSIASRSVLDTYISITIRYASPACLPACLIVLRSSRLSSPLLYSFSISLSLSISHLTFRQFSLSLACFYCLLNLSSRSVPRSFVSTLRPLFVRVVLPYFMSLTTHITHPTTLPISSFPHSSYHSSSRY